MAIYIGANLIGGLIGRQLLTDAITDTSLSIYNMIINSVSKSEDFNSIIVELDILNKIKYLEETCNLIVKSKHNSLTDIALSSIHDMVLQIKSDITIIETKLNFNKTSWKAYLKKKNINVNLKNLRLHSKLLDERIKLYTSTLRCFNSI